MEEYLDFENEKYESYRIEVEVAKVLFYNDSTTYGIISVKPVEKEKRDWLELSIWNNFIIKGTMIRMAEGNTYDIEIAGVQEDKKYGNYHEVIKVHINELNTIESQIQFIKTLLNEKHAEVILETFPNCMIVDKIINDEIDLSECHGIAEKTANKIKKKIQDNMELGGLINELSEINITGNAVKRIVEHFDGASLALQKIRESIYNICEVSGFGFKKVDAYALAKGEKTDSPNRINAYIITYFDELSSQGHSWVDEKTFLTNAIDDLNINGKPIRDFLESEESKAKYIWFKDKRRITTKRMFENEEESLRHLIRINENYQMFESLDIESGIKQAEEELGINYTEEQKYVIHESMKSGVFVLNGRGGTGKSLVMKGIFTILESIGKNTIAVALSGKASNVLFQNGIESATIHRTLGTNKEKFNSFLCDEYSPMQYDCIIVDETSMINAWLFKSLVCAIKNGAKLIIVGDSGQLSAIGHGDILRDLLQNDLFAKFELKKIHRQAQDSGIIEIASLVRDGQHFIEYDFTGQRAFGVNKDMVIKGYEAPRIKEKRKDNNDNEYEFESNEIYDDVKSILESRVKKTTSTDELMEFQIITANNDKGKLSVKSINELAQSIFNPLKADTLTINRKNISFRVNDKVIVSGNTYEIKFYESMKDYYDKQQESFYLPEPEELELEFDENGLPIETEGSKKKKDETDLFNGTMGIIREIQDEIEYNKKSNKRETKRYCFIEFEGVGIVKMSAQDMDTVELAYAVTCHRLQGSTIKTTLVVLDYSSFMLLSRQWFYTAITRASKKCVALVETKALRKAVSTDASGNRRTFLGEMIHNFKK